MARVSKAKLRYIKELYEVPALLDFIAWRKWAMNLITPAVLKRSAETTIVEPGFVRTIALKGYYEGVRKLDRDVDSEVMVSLSKLGAESKYLLPVGGRADRRMGKPSGYNATVKELLDIERIIATGSIDHLRAGDAPDHK